MTDSVQGGERHKRRKISQACDQCRTRKTRCDGAKPACLECVQRPQQKEHCRYSSAQNRDPSHDEYVSSLLNRIQELEARESQPVRDWSDSGRRSDGHTDDPSTASHNETGRQISEVVQGLLAAHNVNTVAQPAAENPSPMDAMGANADVGTGTRREGMFYGSSSMVSFMQQAYSTIGQREPFSRPVSPPAPLTAAANLPVQQILKPRVLEQFALLPRRLSDEILDVYWAKVYHLYPFIHKPAFMQAYERLWTAHHPNNELGASEIGMLGSKNYGDDSVIFHCALNAMLALGTQFMDIAPEDRKMLGDFFGKRSRDMCHLDLFDDGSFAFVQTLLMLGQYLQSTPYPNRCWNCIGIACRLALGLGLHVESSKVVKRLTPLELEIRRRVWHGCVIFDTIVSVTLGRPMMLDKFRSVPLPMTVSGESNPYPELASTDNFSWLSFYVESIRLYRVLADVASQLYGGIEEVILATEHDSRIGIILNISGAISRLEHEISDHLHPTRRLAMPSGIRDLSVYVQQAYILHARYLHVRILLFRPIFLSFCRHLCKHGPSNTTGHMIPPDFNHITQSVARSLSLACIDSSVELIENLERQLATSMTGAWWYNVFFARTATLVILLAMTSEVLDDAVGFGKLNSTWTKCHDVFVYLQRFTPAIRLCLKDLEKMHSLVRDFRGRSARVGDPNADRNTHHAENSYDPRVEASAVVEQSDPLLGNDTFEWLSHSESAAIDEIFSFDIGQAFTFDTSGTNMGFDSIFRS